MSVRVRFAPSPTGMVHVGSLRTALYNYLFARRMGGRCILRIEDTDQSRLVPGAVANLLETMQWAGIEFDEGPVKGGPHGPYVQSERLPLYQKMAGDLLARGAAYRCFCTPADLEKMRHEQEARGEPQKYDGRCGQLGTEESARRFKGAASSVVRLRVPEGGAVAFTDQIRGEVQFNHSEIDPQVLCKSDGFPTYHLANVVDDHEMHITHVIRGEEWLPSTPKHILLYQGFGWEPPTFAHLPLLLNPDKSKLSKRQGDVAVEDYRRKGYLPSAFVNFVALLGWHTADDREIFSMAELIAHFSLERVNKSGAVFDVKKLQWLNGQYLRRLPKPELLSLVHPLLAGEGFFKNHPRWPFSMVSPNVESGFTGWSALPANEQSWLYDLIDMVSPKADLLNEIPGLCREFWDYSGFSHSPACLAELRQEPAPRVVASLREMLRAAPDDFTLTEAKGIIKETGVKAQVKGKDLFHNVRLAISGTGEGLDIAGQLRILGKVEVLRRIEKIMGEP